MAYFVTVRLFISLADGLSFRQTTGRKRDICHKPLENKTYEKKNCEIGVVRFE